MARPAPRSLADRVADRLRRLPLLYAAGTVVALLAWGLAGDTWWAQPLALSTFWWSLPGVALVVVAALARRPRAVALFALPALVWVWSYGTLFLPSTGPDRSPDLRVATYNTYERSPSLRSVRKLVASADPDVLVLQEVGPDREQKVRRVLGDRYPAMMAVQDERAGGVMVLSRFPILETRPVSLSTEPSRDTAVAVLDVDGQPVQVVPVHLTSPCPRCGTSMTERLELEGDRRPAELAAVLRALDSSAPAVIAGDFNSTERSEPYRLLTAVGFEDPHRAVGNGPGFTWPTDRLPIPVVRIDWILTRGLVAVDAWVGDGGMSDHRPVLADLALPEPT